MSSFSKSIKFRLDIVTEYAGLDLRRIRDGVRLSFEDIQGEDFVATRKNLWPILSGIAKKRILRKIQIAQDRERQMLLHAEKNTVSDEDYEMHPMYVERQKRLANAEVWEHQILLDHGEEAVFLHRKGLLYS